MDEYVGDIRQRVLERMDLSREMSDEEIENLIGEELKFSVLHNIFVVKLFKAQNIHSLE